LNFLKFRHLNKLYHICTYNRLPEDEPSGSNHVEDIVKIKILVKQKCILLVYIVRLFYNVRYKKQEILRMSFHSVYRVICYHCFCRGERKQQATAESYTTTIFTNANLRLVKFR
jgi:hypothetical protein